MYSIDMYVNDYVEYQHNSSENGNKQCLERLYDKIQILFNKIK